MVGRSLSAAAPRTALVVRRRLVERLAERFVVRLTLVVGGAGSGKTTALAQAIAADTDHVDVWYPCTSADREGGHFVASLAAACHDVLGGADPAGVDAPAAADALAELVLAASPRQVCLVVDDAHLLTDAAVIEHVLERMPANGHLLLAGRRHPPLATGRLDAAGELVEIAQQELLLTDDEQIEFANLRGIDVATLEGAGGWPAFVELASSGLDVRSRRYLEQEAVASLPPDRTRALAAFAAVGGGDDEIALAVTGRPLGELVADLPLVRWSGEHAQLHDLWGEVLRHELDDGARVAAALAASATHRRRGVLDRAIELAADVAAWDDVETSMAAAVRIGVDGGLRADQLLRWRARLPEDRGGQPVAVLIDALLERERDPTAPKAAELFDRAAAGFEHAGDDELALAALAQLGYLARISGDPERIESAMSRVAAMADRYPPARPFLAFGEAWKALSIARPDLQLAALERIADVDLSPVWRISRDHLMAHALFNLGRPQEALARAPRDIDSLPVPIPGALVTESQCRWYAGHPDVALASRPQGMSTRHGARDRFIAGAWTGMMRAFAGHLDEAREAIRVAEQHLGEQPAPILVAQLAALQLLVKVAEGRDEEAAAELASMLEVVPLGHGVSEQFLRGSIPIPYVLLADTRRYWDTAELGPSHRAVRAVAQAFVQAREDGDLGALATMVWPEPGVLAASFPVRWAIELALHGVRAGRHEGRLLAAWLCERWGESGRRALIEHVDDDTLGEPARDLLAHTPSPPPQHVAVRVLGQTGLLLDGYATADPNWRRERVRALLVWLLLRRSGTRDQAAGALWPELSIPRAAKNLRTTLNYLHDVLEPRRAGGDATWFVRVDGQHIRLHDTLDVDLWRFHELLDEGDRAERQGHPHEALPLLLDATAMWSGDVATDLDHEWLELERIHARSRFVRASCRAAELLVATDQPGDAIEVVTPALAADPYHERSYLALADAYAALGDVTSARAIVARAEDQLGTLATPSWRRRVAT